MFLVVIPLLSVISLFFCAIFAARNYLLCGRVLGRMCPQALLSKLALKDEEENNWGNTELQSAEEVEKEAARAEALAKQRVEFKGEYDLKVFIDRATHLPVSDSPWRDKAMLGSADPYVKILVGHQEARTSIARGTLYPTWESAFHFQFNSDTPHKRPQRFELQIWDYDRAKKDDYIGSVWMPLADIIDQWNARPDKSAPLTLYRTDALRDKIGNPIFGGMKAGGESTAKRKKTEKGNPTEITYQLSMDKVYDTHEATLDLRRAVNWIRGQNAKQKLVSMGKWKDHQRPIDPHTGMERWEHTATDVHAQIGFGAGEEGMQARDIFGVTQTLRGNTFSFRAADLRRSKDGLASDPDERCTDAIRLQDLPELQHLVEHPGLSETNRHRARTLMRRLVAKEEREAEALEAKLEAAPPASGVHMLVCMCAAKDFLKHGRCVCGVAEQNLRIEGQTLHQSRAHTQTAPPSFPFEKKKTEKKTEEKTEQEEAEDHAAVQSERAAAGEGPASRVFKFHHAAPASASEAPAGPRGGRMTAEERRQWREGRARGRQREQAERSQRNRVQEEAQAAGSEHLVIKFRNHANLENAASKQRHVIATSEGAWRPHAESVRAAHNRPGNDSWRRPAESLRLTGHTSTHAAR